MNLGYLGKCAIRQHKATLAVAQQLTGLPYPLIRSSPFLAKGGKRLWYFAPFHAAEDTDYINPYIMNGSFSLELQMKYLHALETGVPMQQGHRLKTIFDDLTEESRVAVRKHFANIVKSSPTSKIVSRMFNEHAKLQFRWDLDFFLEKSNMAFERWRYIYEEAGDSTWFVGYSEIHAALELRIKEIEPAA